MINKMFIQPFATLTGRGRAQVRAKRTWADTTGGRRRNALTARARDMKSASGRRDALREPCLPSGRPNGTVRKRDRRRGATGATGPGAGEAGGVGAPCGRGAPNERRASTRPRNRPNTESSTLTTHLDACGLRPGAGTSPRACTSRPDEWRTHEKNRVTNSRRDHFRGKLFGVPGSARDTEYIVVPRDQSRSWAPGGAA